MAELTNFNCIVFESRFSVNFDSIFTAVLTIINYKFFVNVGFLHECLRKLLKKKLRRLVDKKEVAKKYLTKNVAAKKCTFK